VRLRVEWEASAERELLNGVRSLEEMTSISADVQKLADKGEGPVERFGSDLRTIRMPVAGGRIVSMVVDAFEQTLFVLALTQAPDPDADQDEDPEPDSFEEDVLPTSAEGEAPPSSGRKR